MQPCLDEYATPAPLSDDAFNMAAGYLGVTFEPTAFEPEAVKPETLQTETSDWASLIEFSSATEFRRVLTMFQSLHAEADIRTQASLLINRLGWSVAAVIALIDLGQARFAGEVSRLIRLRASFEKAEIDNKIVPYVSFQLALPQPEYFQPIDSPLQISEALVSFFSPLADACKSYSRLPSSAFWPLVTDSIASAYLLVGRQLHCEEYARVRAESVIKSGGALLNNKRWRFQEYDVMHEQKQIEKTWFSVRGGCCRYYRLDGQDYCATCIHVDENERTNRLLAGE